ncbi:MULTISPECIES: twin-arginine translocation signal domain-containing protein [Klebsiella/Raoultella group]|uniref:twin-arginine translocation signal domain-containing protein n=1 Tax=Raoultella planticola TaxID=575 RepID=UPI0035235379
MMKKNASGEGISRRGLLKGMGIAALAGAAGLSMAPALSRSPMPCRCISPSAMMRRSAASGCVPS